MLVLENLTHRFLRPNILDIKLGTVLYDPKDATVEKQERMKLASLNSTSGELGLRLTGFQVFSLLPSFSSIYLCADKLARRANPFRCGIQS